MDWWVWRVVTHKYIGETLSGMRLGKWTIHDLFRAHVVIDAMEEADRIRHKKAAREQR